MKLGLKLLCLLIFFYLSKLNAQSNLNYQNLFSLFDSYEYEKLDIELDSFNINELPSKTHNDSINKNLTKLLLFNRNKIAINDIRLEEYKNIIEWFIKIGYKKFMPFFINDLSFKAIEYNFFDQSIIRLLNESIIISQEFPNQSHLLSEHNILVSLDALSYLDKKPEEKFNAKHKVDKIKFFKKNSNTLDYFNQTLFYDYVDLTNIEIDEKIKLDAYLNAISLGIKLDKKTDDISSLIRLYRWHVNFDPKKLSLISNDLLTLQKLKVETLINEIFINSLDNNLITKLENVLMSKISSSEIKSLEIFFGEFTLKPLKYIEQNEELKDKDYWFKLCSLRELFSEKYLDNQSQLYSLNNIITVIKYTSNSEKEINKYKLKRFKLIKKLVENDDYNLINSNNFFEYIQYGLDNELITEEEEIRMIFKSFNDKKGYDETIVFLDKYWDYIKGFENIIKIDLTPLRLEIEEKYLTKNDLSSTKLRIKVADTNEKIDGLFKIKGLNDNPEIELLLSEKKYIINKDREFALNYLEKIKLHIDEPFISNHLYNALYITMAFNLEEIISISNKIREEVDKDYFKKDNLRSLSFYLAMGDYFKYLKRNEDSKYYFLKAISNPYYFDEKSYGNLFNYLNSVLYVDFTLFDLEFDSSKLHESEFYQNEYEIVLNNLDSIQKKNNTKKFELNDSIRSVFDLRNFEMKRRLATARNDFSTAQKIITEMIKLSKKFNLNIFDLNDLVSRLDYAKYKNGELSDKDFRDKLISNTSIDNLTKISSLEMLDADSDVIYSSKLKLINEKLNQITLVDNLNYESKILFLSEFYDLFKSLEKTFYEIEKPNYDDLFKLLDIQIKLDNIDNYNSSLLKLDDKKTDEYFYFLNEYYSTKDFEKRLKVKNEFEVFQERNKTSDINLNQGLFSFQKKLKDNQGYIRFSKLKGSDNYVCYIINNNSISYLNLDSIDLERVQKNYTNSINNEILDRVSYKYFFKPIEEKFGPNLNELFVKNDGLSNNINLEAIMIDNNKYVFDKYKINYVEKPFSVNSGGIIEVKNAFLFGNPNFGGSKINSNIRAGLNQLPYTKDEINALNNILINANIEVVKTDFNDSTEEALYENSKSNIVHIATHGFYINDSNSYTRFNWGLLATNAKKSLNNGINKTYKNDGIIYGSEILIKNFTKTELLILSACDTGVGISTNLGVENLSNSFIRAGAKRVISTLWPIDDKITQEFMVLFYENLVNNLNPSEALLIAKANIKGKYIKPKFWAPFILIDNSL